MKVGTMDVTVEVFPSGVFVDGRHRRFNVVHTGERVTVCVNGTLDKQEIAQAAADAVVFLYGEQQGKESISVFVGPKLYVPVVGSVA